MKGIINIKGLEIPCIVMEDGTRVLERKGVEQVVNTFFKSAPRDLLENSLLVKLGDFEGYLIDIIMDLSLIHI